MANYQPFNISTFVNNMTFDGARPNLFDVTFQAQSENVGDNFTLRAESTSLPGSSIGTASAYFFGREAKFAGNRRFDNWTVQILVDEQDYKSGPRFFLESWMNKLNGHVANVRDSAKITPNDYQKDGYVRHYSKDGKGILAEYKMVQCFPVDISPINLGWDQNDQIERFSVTFAMQWWESNTGSTDKTSS
jgi:hypothetical protein